MIREKQPDGSVGRLISMLLVGPDGREVRESNGEFVKPANAADDVNKSLSNSPVDSMMGFELANLRRRAVCDRAESAASSLRRGLPARESLKAGDCERDPIIEEGSPEAVSSSHL